MHPNSAGTPMRISMNIKNVLHDLVVSIIDMAFCLPYPSLEQKHRYPHRIVVLLLSFIIASDL